MSLDEVVIGEVKANRSRKVLALFAECQSEASQSAHVKACRSIQTLDVAGRDQIEIRTTGNGFLFAGDELRGAVAAIIFHCYAAIGFDDLAVVGIPARPSRPAA